ncbi:hypothetical protein [Cohnella nanjingensis]|uniref:Uncharacterized protein n=1 Tax=Cohnella nanjingensis TaxID=1387779 RepID=A0A7X0VFZ3_9BACL|nr:hypothetical protein [Cohnella nanjingensis]MBB6672311.1 hypothetical protein [Cohnella nanjingensis]
MLNVRHAMFRRVLERGEQRYAEVEVHTDAPRDPELLAYFRREGNGSFQLVRVISHAADHEWDWFDNSMHAGYQDVTARMFNGPSHGAPDDRHAFGRRILEREDIQAELARHLP